MILENKEDTHLGAKEILQKEVISVVLSWIYDNPSANETSVEETFMHFCKSRAGKNPASIAEFLTTYAAYKIINCNSCYIRTCKHTLEPR